MPEESITFMGSFTATWFTPTYLFLFLNLTIGTIALISRFTTPQTQLGHDYPPRLVRAPSLIERVKSFDFALYRSGPSVPDTLQTPLGQEDYPPQLVRTPSLLERVKSFNFSLYSSESSEPDTLQTRDETPDRNPGTVSVQDNGHHVSRTMSEPKKESGEDPPEKMKKSASEKLVVKHSEEEEIVERQRPATVRERKGRRTSETESFGDHDDEVDAKADDFINRFKQQLKLQRLDSLLRYKDMLSRGAS